MKKILLASFAFVSLLVGATSFAPTAQAQATTGCAITTAQASALTQLIRSAPNLDQNVFVTFMTGFSSGCITTPQASAFTQLIRSAPNLDQNVFVDFLTSFTSGNTTTTPTPTVPTPTPPVQTLPAGCLPGYLYSPITGQRCVPIPPIPPIPGPLSLDAILALGGYHPRDPNGLPIFVLNQVIPMRGYVNNMPSNTQLSFEIERETPARNWGTFSKFTYANHASLWNNPQMGWTYENLVILSANVQASGITSGKYRVRAYVQLCPTQGCNQNPDFPGYGPTPILINSDWREFWLNADTVITVTAPNGGERWEIGQLNTITWAPYSYNQYGEPDINPARDVRATLINAANGFLVGDIMDTGKASLHTYFNLGNYTNFAQPGQYYVRVDNRVTGATDRSDAPFTLLPRSVDVRVNDSDGPVSLYDNQPITVMVTTNNVTSCTLSGVRASIGGSYSGIPFTPNTSASMYAFAPAGGGSTSIYATCYKSDGSIRSDGVQVNITSSSASLQVVSPNGGESIVVSDTTQVKIAWRMDGITTPISIALYKNDQWLFWIEKALYLDKSDGTYSYVWAPNAKGPTLPNFSIEGNSGYKIYITGQKADGTDYVNDKSDAPFGFVGVTTTSAPTLTLTANPSTINAGQSTTLSWSSTNANSCTLGVTGFNSVFVDAADSQLVTPPLGTSYTLTCTGPGGSVTKSVTVTVGSTTSSVSVTVDRSTLSTSSSRPTFTGSATGLYSVELVLYNSSNNIVGASGSTAVQNGRWTMGPLAQTIPNGTYRLEIRGRLSSDDVNEKLYATETVIVASTAVAPTLTFTASPSSVTAGQSSTLSWTSTGATYCKVSGTVSSPGLVGTETVSTSGTLGTGSVGATTIYTMTCSGPGGSVTKSVTVGTTVSYPTAATRPATNISTSSARLVGVVNANNLPSVYSSFRYGTASATCAGAGTDTIVLSNPSLITGSASTTVARITRNLTPNTTYYFCMEVVSGGKISAPASLRRSFRTLSLPVPTEPAGNGGDPGGAFDGGAGAGAAAITAFDSATAESSSGTAFSYTFTQDLYRGVEGTEVAALQRALTLQGLFNEEITGNFYDVTLKAVRAFQTQYGINATGYVGPETRSRLNALYSR